MNHFEIRRQDDLLTVGSISMVVFALANILHEAVGHDGACLLVGGKAHVLSSMHFEGDAGNPLGWKNRVMAAGGTIVNFLAAGVGYGALRHSTSLAVRLVAILGSESPGGNRILPVLWSVGRWRLERGDKRIEPTLEEHATEKPLTELSIFDKWLSIFSGKFCNHSAPISRTPWTRMPTAPRKAYALAYCSALVTSIPTKRSFPSTHASCPGGIVYESPAENVFFVPPFSWTVRRPETT